MARMQGCSVLVLDDSDKLVNKYDHKVTVVCSYDPQGMAVRLLQEGATPPKQLEEYLVSGAGTTHLSRGHTSHMLVVGGELVLFRFASRGDCQQFRSLLHKLSGKVNSVFNLRTEDSSASQYFQFYGYLSQQQNMMQDFVRTSTYQRAIYNNAQDFQNKIVLDVGAGSGKRLWPLLTVNHYRSVALVIGLRMFFSVFVFRHSVVLCCPGRCREGVRGRGQQYGAVRTAAGQLEQSHRSDNRDRG